MNYGKEGKHKCSQIDKYIDKQTEKGRGRKRGWREGGEMRKNKQNTCTALYRTSIIMASI